MNNYKLEVQHIKTELDYLNMYRFKVYENNKVIISDSIDDIGQGNINAINNIKDILLDCYDIEVKTQSSDFKQIKL